MAEQKDADLHLDAICINQPDPCGQFDRRAKTAEAQEAYRWPLK